MTKGKNIFFIFIGLLFLSLTTLHPLNHEEDFLSPELEFECTLCKNENKNKNLEEPKISPVDSIYKKITLNEYIHVGKTYSSFSSRAPPY